MPRPTSVLAIVGAIVAIVRYWENQRALAVLGVVALVGIVLGRVPMVAAPATALGYGLLGYAVLGNVLLAFVFGVGSMMISSGWAAKAHRPRETGKPPAPPPPGDARSER